jgi:polyhydroxybutyrate depolymerase
VCHNLLGVVRVIVLRQLDDAIADNQFWQEPGACAYAMQVDGLTRTIRVHIPLSWDGTRQLPVVLMLHGYGGNAWSGLAQGRWVPKAEQAIFLAVGLDGTLKYPDRREHFPNNPRSWSSGTGVTPAEQNGVDDMRFIRHVIEQLLTTHRVDARRIYVTGFSNGGAMAFRVGAELSEYVAAIAPVANTLLVQVEQLTRPVSLLMIWGTDDPINSMQGGVVTYHERTIIRPSAIASLQKWGQLLKCAPDLKSTVPQAGIERFTLHAEVGNAEAVLYTIKGMGHYWPGGVNFLSEQVAGQRSHRLNATDLIWDFFCNHPMV